MVTIGVRELKDNLSSVLQRVRWEREAVDIDVYKRQVQDAAHHVQFHLVGSRGQLIDRGPSH